MNHNFDKLFCWCCSVGCDFCYSMLLIPCFKLLKLFKCSIAFYAFSTEFYFGLSVAENDFGFLNLNDLIGFCDL